MDGKGQAQLPAQPPRGMGSRQASPASWRPSCWCNHGTLTGELTPASLRSSPRCRALHPQRQARSRWPVGKDQVSSLHRTESLASPRPSQDTPQLSGIPELPGGGPERTPPCLLLGVPVTFCRFGQDAVSISAHRFGALSQLRLGAAPPAPERCTGPETCTRAPSPTPSPAEHECAQIQTPRRFIVTRFPCLPSVSQYFTV